MFPIKDENPIYHKAIVTYTIIGLNVLSWFFIQGMGFNPALIKSICTFGAIPGELLGRIPPGTHIPIARGIACVIDGNPNWTTIVSSMFMHGGWLHLIGNMWFLYIFGDNVEDVLGPVKFILFYLICGLSAVAVQMISNPSSPVPMVGASGAIGGIMGAYIVLFPRAPIHMLVFFGFFFMRFIVPAFFMLGYWFMLQVLGGFFNSGTGGVAFWAHIGGFISGIVLLKIFCNSQRVEECKRKRGVTGKLIKRYAKK